MASGSGCFHAAVDHAPPAGILRRQRESPDRRCSATARAKRLDMARSPIKRDVAYPLPQPRAVGQCSDVRICEQVGAPRSRQGTRPGIAARPPAASTSRAGQATVRQPRAAKRQGKPVKSRGAVATISLEDVAVVARFKAGAATREWVGAVLEPVIDRPAAGVTELVRTSEHTPQ